MTSVAVPRMQDLQRPLLFEHHVPSAIHGACSTRTQAFAYLVHSRVKSARSQMESSDHDARLGRTRRAVKPGYFPWAAGIVVFPRTTVPISVPARFMVAARGRSW